MKTPRETTTLYESLTAEQQAKVDAHRAARNAPGVREAEVRDREALREEYRSTGANASDDDPIRIEDEFRLIRFVGEMRRRREELGLTLEVVSERSGIDQPALSRLENSKGNPTARTLSRYCHAIGGRLVFGFEVE